MSRHISNDEFFTSLTALLSTHASSARGSIFLTQKRMPTTPTSTDNAVTPSPSASLGTHPILIRATNGKHKAAKTKLSTVVAPEDLEGFYVRYAEVCKAGMTGMKKRDRSAKKKGKKEKKEKKAV